MIIQSESRSLDTRQPIIDYKSFIDMALQVRKVSNGAYKSRSQTPSHDSFYCDFNLKLNEADSIVLDNIITLDKGQTITISDFDGFYPFTPAFSDTVINITIVGNSKRGDKATTFGDYFDFSLRITANQDLTLISDIGTKKEGSLGFAGLTMLQDASNDYRRGFAQNVATLGTKNYVTTYDSDSEHEAFKLSFGNSCKDTSGMLIKRLISIYRHLPISIIGANNYFIKGVNGGSTWSGDVGLLNGVIEITHNVNYFNFGLECYVV